MSMVGPLFGFETILLSLWMVDADELKITVIRKYNCYMHRFASNYLSKVVKT